MKALPIIPIFVVLFSFLSCKSGNSYAPSTADSTKIEYSKVVTDSTSIPVSSSAAIVSKKDSERKFVRTADLKFKVKSVVKATYDIEDVVNNQGGFVTFTNLASTIDNTSNTQVSEDSTLETTFYNVTNTMTIRVPNNKLDTTLKEIAKNVDYLDYRIIKADDVALQLLSNELTQKRATKNEARVVNAIDTKGKKLGEITDAETTLVNKQEAADNARIANLSLLDQVSFSTITINIYQKQTLKRELICNNKSTKEYEPNFGIKVMESLQYGWDMLETIIVSVVKLWGLILLGLITYLIYRKYGRKIKK